MPITISRHSILTGTVHQLPSSKSISNRALLLQALAGNQSVVSNLSTARDTRLMQKLVGSDDHLIDVKDAGTTMRFLTAYFALSGKEKILTGTDRMKQRPIGLLVDALRKLGASIEYLEQDGFPPIQTKGFERQLSNVVSLPGNVSSQYISALMMMAPSLPEGLTIRMEGHVGSRPYIDMTAALMKSFGITCQNNGNDIHINPQAYTPAQISVEADWSAASYWFAFVALAEKAELTLPNVTSSSLQGDRAIVEAMERLGVKTRFTGTTAVLTKQSFEKNMTWHFADCPDLAQTILPVCALLGVSGVFTGMESLRIKETDRIAALQNELGQIGAQLTEDSGTWILTPGTFRDGIFIHTYHDHRMAMGFAPWATRGKIAFEDPEVVNKSYPGFWEDMKSLGFEIS